jgi:hypothetical protein
MNFARTIVGAAAATCLAGAPALANPQHGHAAAPQPHATGAKSGMPPAASHKTTTTTTTARPGASHTSTRVMNPIAAKIAAKPQLNARITAMLPPHLSLDRASRGFKNQGQFIAALHVSKNLGIPFKDLKNDMTKRNMSLGQSIQDLKKSAPATTEARRGEVEAHEDLKAVASGPSVAAK